MWKLFIKLAGWKVNASVPEGVGRCVMIAAPHTSNWDFPFMIAAFRILKLKVRFTIKDSWFKFPFNLVIGPLGGIAIDRTPKKEGEERLSIVEAMANLFADNKQLVVLVTPEGTRAKRTQWKSGFYHTAKLAGVPICLGYLDYEKKIAGVGAVVHPSDDMEADMRKIMAFYKDLKGEHPEKFSLDERYS